MLISKKIIFITFVVFFLAIVTLLCYFPVLQADFLNFDDNVYVYNNPDIKSLSLHNIKNIFSKQYTLVYVPLAVVSYAVEYHFFALNPKVYHLTNVFLHFLNSVLIFFFILLLNKKIFLSDDKYAKQYLAAFLTALLFSVAAVNVETVAWISERKGLLCTSFFFLTLICYLLFLITEKYKKLFYTLALFLFILTCFSKSTGLMLPVILLTINFFIEKKSISKNNLYNFVKKQLFLLPFFLLSLTFGLITVFIQHSQFKQYYYHISGYNKNFFTDFLLACRNIVFYLEKTFAPLKLNCLYPQSENLLTCVFSLIILLIIGAFAFFLFKKNNNLSNKILFGLLWFFIMILPLSQLFSEFGMMRVADRLACIPSVGLFFSAASWFAHLLTKKHKLFPALAIVFYVLVCGLLTHSRVKIWLNSITLFSNTVKSPCQYSFAWNFLGAAYSEKTNSFAKFICYHNGVDENVNDTQSLINLGRCYDEKGDKLTALTWYERAVESNPYVTLPRFNRGAVLYTLGRYKEALIDFEFVLKYNPDNKKAEFYYNKIINNHK